MSIRTHIPNAITSLNLLCGVVGVVFALGGRPDIAFFLMLAAGLFDFCDGLAARLLGAHSPIGGELDSMADMVSFGVLPSVMLYACMKELGCTPQLCFIPLLIAVFSGIRLAKFNVDERQHTSFLGLPTPTSAIICGSLALFCHACPDSRFTAICSIWFVIPLLTVILCALLVSEVPMFSFKTGRDGASWIRDMKRTAFLCISALIIIIVLVLGLHWTIVPLGIFSSYVIENLLFAAFKIR